MKCKRCGSEWNVDVTISNKIKKCPFCGEVLELEDVHTTKEIDSLEEAIRVVYRIGGEEVICSKQLAGYFSDLAPALKKYNILIKNLVSVGGNVRLFKAALLDEPHRKIQIIRVVESLQEDYFLDRGICIKLCENFCKAIYLEKQGINKTDNWNSSSSVDMSEKNVWNEPINCENSHGDATSSYNIKMLEDMAEQGDSKAQYLLAEHYYKRNQLSEAFLWYERGADNGNSKAMYKISVLFGMSGSYSKAAEICKKAAELGNVDAQYEYAVMVEKGIGTLKDMNIAKKWYYEAAKQGDIRAQKKYDELK